jgi:hypothetical protein
VNLDCWGLDRNIAIARCGVGSWVDDYGLGYIIFLGLLLDKGGGCHWVPRFI